MNKIEQELAKLMADNKYKLPIQKGDTGVQVVDIPNATSNCYSLLEKHCIGFAKFIKDNFYCDESEYSAYNYSKYFTDEKLNMTENQAFKLYIEQL